MKPTNFPESTKELSKPEGMTDEECESMHVFTDGKQCISKWKMSFRERWKALFKGHVWIGVHSGYTQPPVWVSVNFPFIKPKATMTVEDLKKLENTMRKYQEI